MNPTMMLLPMFAMVLLTLVLAANTLRVRAAAVHSGTVRMSRFRAMQGDVPEHVAVAERAFQNALEVPPLFYAAGIAAIALQAVDAGFVWLGWGYVAARVVHAAIHLGYNDIVHRLLAYMASWLVLLAMWGRLALLAL